MNPKLRKNKITPKPIINLPMTGFPFAQNAPINVDTSNPPVAARNNQRIAASGELPGTVKFIFGTNE